MGKDIVGALRQAMSAARGLDFSGAAASLRIALGDSLPPVVPASRPDARRQSLGQVVADLAGRPMPVPLAPPPGLEPRSFECAAGRRNYRLFVPPGPVEGLILMLHGCLQTPEDFAVGTGMNALAADRGLVVAWPEQETPHNARHCWSWFEPEHQQRGAGEPAILAGLATALAAEFGVPPSRVFVAGLSAGGSMAAVLGEGYPDIFAAVGVHSGLACGTAHDARSAIAAMRGAPAAARPLAPGDHAPRVIVFQGTSDAVVHPMNADRLAARACALAGVRPSREGHTSFGDRAIGRSVARGPDGQPIVELWMIEGTGHAWSGGRKAGSFTDPAGPDASAEMVRFFLAAG
ncbi:MAG: PHB depolymerase family esterase [Amaricoccus sp.]|uniref:extracellular catalytic domain type 1 short-chain-length polyhydroxyalkanoate depolymerase n=1 Tax=Amaricoccus sp. TaxID=1872485 RepID=UPI0039E2C803